jgi:hypothetical protein
MAFNKHGLLKFTLCYKSALLIQELNYFPAFKLLLHGMRLMLGSVWYFSRSDFLTVEK